MSYLLDTNVLSETRRPTGNPHVRDFITSIGPEAVYISVLTLGEIRKGAHAKRLTEPRFAGELLDWLAQIERSLSDRILPVNAEIAQRWGIFSSDRSRSVVDTMLAATASVYGLTLVTRNVKDVAGLDVPVLNPWTA